MSRWLFLPFLLIACSKGSFEYRGVVLFKGGKAFTGTRMYQQGSTQKHISYVKGLKEGTEKQFYSDGTLKKIGSYLNGQPTGEHWTYYASGAKKKFTNFENGLHHGDYIEWFESGQVSVYSKFEEGRELGHKKWRPDGKIYANYVVSNGKNIGLSGGKLCFNAKDKEASGNPDE